MLVLPIKKKWFDMIKSGEKKEEYREIKSYWIKRFGWIENVDNKHKLMMIQREVILRNGYRKDSPKLKCLCNIKIDYGKEEWGAEPNKLYYVLNILNVEEINE